MQDLRQQKGIRPEDEVGDSLNQIPLESSGSPNEDFQVGKDVRLNGSILTIESILGRGGEGISYKAKSDDGKYKTLKVVGLGPHAFDDNVAKKINGRMMRVNKALGQETRVFTLEDGQNFAVLSDCIAGDNLENILTQRNATLPESEAKGFMRQILQNYLVPLNDEGIIHRDIKPTNIIEETTEKGKAYHLIDFGIAREQGSLSLTTMGINAATIGYSKIPGTNDCRDDLFSLAKTAYFLLRGRGPSPEGSLTDRADEFDSLAISPDFKKILKKMVLFKEDKKIFARQKGYASPEEVLKDLEKLNEDSMDEIDPKFSGKISTYREKAKFPLELQREINGLVGLFSEEYNGSVNERNPLSDDFKKELDLLLKRIGYEREEKFMRYKRKLKDSKKIECLICNSSGEKYFKYFVAKDNSDLEKRLNTSYKDKNIYEKISNDWVTFFGAIVSGIATGTTIGYNLGQNPEAKIKSALVGGGIAFFPSLAVGLIGAVNYEEGNIRKNSSPALTFIPFIGWPHGIGLATEKIVNYVGKKMHERKTKSLYASDKSSLEKALKPAKYFVYD